MRFCVDMRIANKAIVRQRYPVLALEDILNDIGRSSWFSTLDVRSSYHQIELDEESKEITNFAPDSRLYRYKWLIVYLSIAHPGIVAVKNRLPSKVWWDIVDKYAEKCVNFCASCQLVKKIVCAIPVSRYVLPERPWESLAIVLLGPLPSGESLLVVVDYYSRYYEVEILKITTVLYIAQVVITRLKEIFARHGLPKIIVCEIVHNLLVDNLIFGQ